MANAKFADVCEGKGHGEDTNRGAIDRHRGSQQATSMQRTPRPRYEKYYVATSFTQFFPKKKLAGAAPTKNRRKNKKKSRRGAPPKKKAPDPIPHIFRPTLPPRFLPPPAMAIAHACTQINQAHAGTLTHATTKHGLRGSALRALDVTSSQYPEAERPAGH